MKVSVSDLKNDLSRYLREVEAGEEVVVMSHHHAVAKLTAIALDDVSEDDLKNLAGCRDFSWSGKKPKLRAGVANKGRRQISDLVLEQRR